MRLRMHFGALCLVFGARESVGAGGQLQEVLCAAGCVPKSALTIAEEDLRSELARSRLLQGRIEELEGRLRVAEQARRVGVDPTGSVGISAASTSGNGDVSMRDGSGNNNGGGADCYKCNDVSGDASSSLAHTARSTLHGSDCGVASVHLCSGSPGAGGSSGRVGGAGDEGNRTIPAGRMCLVYLLDRGGGFDAAIASARRQADASYTLLVLDQLSGAARRQAANRLADAANVSLNVRDVPRGKWRASDVWRLARDVCQTPPRLDTAAEAPVPPLEVVGIARQGVLLPAGFVQASLHFHTNMHSRPADGAVEAAPSPAKTTAVDAIGRSVRPALLVPPLWRFLPPLSEVNADALAAPDAAATLFSPPLDALGYSRRGWQMHATMPVAERAELAGGGPSRLKRPMRMPEGAWSVSAGAVAGLRMLPTDPRWAAQEAAATAKAAREGGAAKAVAAECRWGKAQAAQATVWIADMSLLAQVAVEPEQAGAGAQLDACS